MINLTKFPYFSLDTETTGLIYPRDKAFGISFATPDGNSVYYDLRKRPKLKKQISSQLENYRGIIICHNASFDHRMSASAEVKLPIARLDDTVTRACCINEHLFSYELDNLCIKYLGKEKKKDIYEELAAIFGGKPTKTVQMPNIHLAPESIVAPYAEYDAVLALELWLWQLQEIARQGIEDITQFERGLMPTIIRAEMRGIRTDLEYAEEAADKLTPILDKKQKKLNKLAGKTINTNSPPQVKKLFSPKKRDGNWFASDGTLLAKTPKGNASLGSDALRSIKDPMAPLILEIRSLIKTRDTFLRGHVLGHAVNGRVYPTINQNKGEDGGTGTGRLSYQKPAMQQIPTRNKEVACIIKPCFLPDEGMIWVDADMASFEVRVFAHLVNNPVIIQAYLDNPLMDFHQFVANLTGLVRNATYSGEPNSKQLNLSMIFNSGNGAIADKMGMDWGWESFIPRGKTEKDKITYKKAGPEAEAIIAKYHRRIPGIKELATGCKNKAENRGYIFTKTGRRLRFPRGYKSYKASGLLIQATSADENKKNWMKIEKELDGAGHIILNTHDSYSMCMPEDNWEDHYNRVKAGVEKTDLRVPLILELSGVGTNWWNALINKGV